MSNKAEYDAEYLKQNVKRVVLNINRKTMPDVFEYLSNLPDAQPVQGYILSLIRDDMKRQGLEVIAPVNRKNRP